MLVLRPCRRSRHSGQTSRRHRADSLPITRCVTDAPTFVVVRYQLLTALRRLRDAARLHKDDDGSGSHILMLRPALVLVAKAAWILRPEQPERRVGRVVGMLVDDRRGGAQAMRKAVDLDDSRGCRVGWPPRLLIMERGLSGSSTSDRHDAPATRAATGVGKQPAPVPPRPEPPAGHQPAQPRGQPGPVGQQPAAAPPPRGRPPPDRRSRSANPSTTPTQGPATIPQQHGQRYASP